MALDGNSIVNRAFYGVRQLSTRDGTPTNGVFGFLQILQKLITDESPDAICVAFDLKAPTFRHELYAGYKSSRKGMPDELAAQMPILKDVLDAMNIRRYELSGWEADDLLGAFSTRCEADGWDCVIVTGDKDSLQLVTDKTRVKLVKSRMGQTETRDYTPGVFFDEYGFEPKKMIDLKSLMGDKSDEIPGVRGVGEKTAMELVQKYGGVTDIYEKLDALDIRDTLRQKLVTGYDDAQLSHNLATIRCDAPIEFSPADSAVKPYDNDALYALFTKLEFTKFIDKFGLTAAPGDSKPNVGDDVRVVTVVSDGDLSAFYAAIAAAETVSVRVDGELSAAAVFDAATKTSYALREGATPGYENALRAVFAENVAKAGHDIKDTIRSLSQRGIASGGWVFDSALAAYLLSPTERSYDIGALVSHYCGAVFTSGGGEAQLSLLDAPDAGRELSNEAAAVALLYDTLPKLLEESKLGELLRTIELPLCCVLADMETVGFLVDRAALREFGEMLSVKIAELEATIYELSGETFNIQSPKQLGVVLFETLMLPAPKKTKTGYSTNIDVLEKLLDKHPVITHIIEYRQLTKLKATYSDGLTKVIAPDGRIHTSFQMTVTATGRLSSTEPNLQNIPVRRELGGELRKMFIAKPGCVLVDADYSQIELRLLSVIADDKLMQGAFLSGEDIHAVTASQVFGIPLAEVTSAQRSRAKAVNFGIVYGISAFSLAQDIKVPVYEAREYMDSYLDKYSGVRAHMAEIVAQAKRDGYVTTLFGRRRYLPELKSSDYNTRAFGERVALNMPVQGTAADIMKLAMVNVWKRITREKLSAKLILQVHDELIVECPESERESVSTLLREEMESAVTLSVPLIAETHSGVSWYDAK
jgi:DNA polymerase-1